MLKIKKTFLTKLVDVSHLRETVTNPILKEKSIKKKNTNTFKNFCYTYQTITPLYCKYPTLYTWRTK